MAIRPGPDNACAMFRITDHWRSITWNSLAALTALRTAVLALSPPPPRPLEIPDSVHFDAAAVMTMSINATVDSVRLWPASFRPRPPPYLALAPDAVNHG